MSEHDDIMDDGLEQCNLMPHTDRYPNFSRDWEDIDCSNEACINNNPFSKKCIVPSLAKIGDDGLCKGFKARKIKEDLKPKNRTAIEDLEIE